MTNAHVAAVTEPVGILLAAGRGRRFDGSGASNKLLACIDDDLSVIAASAGKLLAVLRRVVAVVRFDDGGVADVLRALGCDVTVCPHADSGMAASLAHGVGYASPSAGVLIALGDMPHVQAATLRALCGALGQGADIAVPFHDGRRGNPVAFGAVHVPALLALQGDQGARALLRSHPVVEVAVCDPGIFLDIDTRDDLAKNGTLPP